jgi:DNA-binding transcriptional LysR family regulator
MNWNDLHLLLALSRSRTMTEAASRLGVNQTTVSRRVSALEQDLGVELVRRQREGVQLTEAGARAARSAAVMETEAHDLERELLGRDRQLAGTLQVTTTDVIAVHHADLFTGFAVEHPNIDLELDTSPRPRSLTRREADVAIRWTVSPDPNLYGRKLVRVEYAVYGSRGLVGAEADVAALPWVAYTLASDAVLSEAWRLQHAPDAQVVCRYTRPLPLFAAIRAGQGIGFMPCAYGDADPGVVRLTDVQPGFGYDIWILTHPDLSRTERVRAFLAHAGAHFDACRGAYAGRR